MSNLGQWEANRWIKHEVPTEKEVADLLRIVRRDLDDARRAAATLSLDNQLLILYNASLALAHIALRLKGYRVAQGAGHHQRTIDSLPLTLGPEWNEAARFLDGIRRKRNRGEYDAAGIASANDVRDLVSELASLDGAVTRAVDAWRSSQ
jgi:hypothetical protein